jgi:hypothetical protein
MRKLLHPFAVGLIAMLMSAPAPAQSPDAVAAAKELMVVMHATDTFKALLPSIVQMLKPVVAQGRPEVERDYDALAPGLVAAMESQLEPMLDRIASIYGRNFTAAELREITAFYRGATGQKFVQRQAAITQESMAIGQQIGQQLGGQLQQRMIEELRKKGHNI